MSSISDEKAIITIEVDLVSKVTGDPVGEKGESGFFTEHEKDTDDQVEQAIKDSIDEAIEDVFVSEGIDMDSLGELTKLMKDVDSKGMNNLKSMATNPAGFMQGTIMGILGRAGPYGALAAAIIGVIAATPAMASAVVEALGVKGGPLNQDFALTQDEQYGQAFSREVQYRRITGDDPVITVTTKGFVAGDEDFNDNSLVDVETGRMGRVSLNQNSVGLIYGP
jgi:hypothetical protein